DPGLELGDVVSGLMDRVLDQERVLVGEMVVHRRAPDLGSPGDGRKGDRLEILGLQQLVERGEDLHARALTVLLERPSDDLGHAALLHLGKAFGQWSREPVSWATRGRPSTTPARRTSPTRSGARQADQKRGGGSQCRSPRARARPAPPPSYVVRPRRPLGLPAGALPPGTPRPQASDLRLPTQP